MAIENQEGLRRGSMLTGRLAPRGPMHLFTVTKVTGKHSVMAVTETENMTVEINLTTNGMHNKDSKWKRVEFRSDLSDRPSEELGGFIVFNRGFGR